MAGRYEPHRKFENVDHSGTIRVAPGDGEKVRHETAFQYSMELGGKRSSNNTMRSQTGSWSSFSSPPIQPRPSLLSLFSEPLSSEPSRLGVFPDYVTGFSNQHNHNRVSTSTLGRSSALDQKAEETSRPRLESHSQGLQNQTGHLSRMKTKGELEDAKRPQPLTTPGPISDMGSERSPLWKNAPDQIRTGLQALFEETPDFRGSAKSTENIYYGASRDFSRHPGNLGHSPDSNNSSPVGGTYTSSTPPEDTRPRSSVASTNSSECSRCRRLLTRKSTPQDLSILFAYTAVLKPRIHCEIHELEANARERPDCMEICELEAPLSPGTAALPSAIAVSSETEGPAALEEEGLDKTPDDEAPRRERSDGEVAAREWFRKSRVLHTNPNIFSDIESRK